MTGVIILSIVMWLLTSNTDIQAVSSSSAPDIREAGRQKEPLQRSIASLSDTTGDAHFVDSKKQNRHHLMQSHRIGIHLHDKDFMQNFKPHLYYHLQEV